MYSGLHAYGAAILPWFDPGSRMSAGEYVAIPHTFLRLLLLFSLDAKSLIDQIPSPDLANHERM